MNDKMKSDKLRTIGNALKALEKTTKKEGIAYILGDKNINLVESFSSGSLMFDLALGVGGIPKGRIIEFFGAESSGKTLCAIKAAAECQRAGGIVAFVDMEHTFDPIFAQKLGLNTKSKDVIISQPDHLQDAFNVIDTMIEAGVDLIILDSVAALVPREELEGEIGKQTIGLIARYMSQFLRRITPKTAKNKSTVIFVNQTRDNIGVMYGNPITTPGGKSLKFYSSIRVEVAKVGGSNVSNKIGGEDITVGHSIRVKIVKNKVAPPFRRAEFPIFYDGRPQKKSEELAAVALLKGLIPKYDSQGNISPTGRTYKYNIVDENGEIIEELIAKKKDEVAIELEKCPKIQEKLLDILKNGIEEELVFTSDNMDSDLSDEEFEEKIKTLGNNLKNLNEAEEDDDSWGEYLKKL